MRVATLALLALITIASALYAAVPQTIGYQGYLKNADGTPVNTQVSVTFSLYSSNPSRNNPVWTEKQNVTPANGIYGVQLGAFAPLVLPFDVPYWLGVQVGSDPEMTPLQPLSAVPYALHAATADAASMINVSCPDGAVLVYKANGGWQCGVVKPLPNAAGTCVGENCTISACAAGYGDCDHVAANGCETDLVGKTATPQNCGACGNVCTAPTNMTGNCMNGACGTPTCNTGWGDCNKNLSDGCEVYLLTDLKNCGACGTICASVANGTPSCANGVCGIATCAAGYGDCNNNPADGCETNLNSSIYNCGACGHVCASVTNGTPVCSNGACGIAACTTGYANCNNDPSDGCETNIQSSVNNCGGCGTVCSSYNISPACTNGVCTGTCNAGYADCNGNKQVDGCETNITNNTSNCGGCGITCSSNHMATTTCSNGACSGTCTTGYADCNNNKQIDGCETNLNTDNNNCGACGNVCPWYAPTCNAGTCG